MMDGKKMMILFLLEATTLTRQKNLVISRKDGRRKDSSNRRGSNQGRQN